jgi:ACS family tartrate transporter-like MFS transporter
VIRSAPFASARRTDREKTTVSKAKPIDGAAVSAGIANGPAIIRKISLRLLPIIALGFGISYIDRANISFAALQMNRDLHFSASIYGLGAGLFFLSYAVCELPSNLLLVRFGARRWIARIMFTWGLLAMGMMFVKTPIQFYAMRLLLGAAEAGFFPGVVFYLMQWFPPEMRARAISRFYVAVPLSTVFMGLIAGSLLNLQGRLGLAGWQWLFLVEGLPAILLSVALLVYLPDGPAEAKWLTREERAWILDRAQPDRSTGSMICGDEIGRALLDYRVVLLGLFYFCSLGCGYAYSLSAPDIVQKLTGLSIANVGLVVAAMSLFNALCVVLVPLHSDRSHERFLHIAIPALLAATGFVLAGFFHAALIAIPALAIGQTGLVSAHPVLWSLPANFLKDRAAAAGIAVLGSFGILGGFLGPVLMGRVRDATQSYRIGIASLSVPILLATAVILLLRGLAAKNSGSRTAPPTIPRIGYDGR